MNNLHFNIQKHTTVCQLFFLAIVGLFLMPQHLSAQDIETPKLYVGGSDIAVRSVNIGYEISFPGYVELHLYTENDKGEKKKIWIKGKVHDETGKQVFRIPRKPLEPAKRYSFELMYKGKSYEGSFYHPEENS